MRARSGLSGLDVSVGVLGQLVSYLQARQANLESLFCAAGADLRLLDDPDARLPLETYLALEDTAADMTGDPCLGLHMGEFHEPGNWSLAGHFMSRCSTLGELAIKGGKYHRIIGNLISSKAWLIPGAIRVKLVVPRQTPPMSRHCYESVLSSTVTLTRRLSGRHLTPLAVRLPGDQPEDDSEYRRVFGCPVKFGCKIPGMDLPLDFISTPVLAPDPESAARFAAWMDDCLERIPDLRPTESQVTRCILGHSGDTPPTVQTVARELGFSSRTLQNLLAEEGSDFSTVHRRVRQDLACRWLRESRSVEEITWMLGFAEPSVFRKAFKKWTGATPQEYRRGTPPSGLGA